MQSPFPYETIATKNTFYGRKEEIKRLKLIFQTSNNILIHSKRRMGKSTLIKEIFRRLDNEYICIYCDIFDMVTKEDFARELIKAISNIPSSDNIKTLYEKFTNIFKRVRVEPTFDANSSKFSLRPVVATLSFEDMIEDFFDALQELVKEKRVILAIDEFQQISTLSDIKLDAMLRKKIQSIEKVSWCFLGSKRHLLTSLFEYKAPLYELATHLELVALRFEEVFAYTKKYIKIDEDMMKYIYEICNSETKLLQNICHILWLEKQIINKQSIDEVVLQIINSKESSYKLVFDMLNNNQKITLKILAKYKKNIYTQEVLKEFNIKKQTLQSAINTLYKKEILDKKDDMIYLPDRTFELWIEKVFGYNN